MEMGRVVNDDFDFGPAEYMRYQLREEVTPLVDAILALPDPELAKYRALSEAAQSLVEVADQLLSGWLSTGMRRGIDRLRAVLSSRVDPVLTLEADLAQERHVREQLQDELTQVREALEGTGLEYNQGYGAPVRQLVAVHETAKAELEHLRANTVAWGESYDRLHDAARELLAAAQPYAGLAVPLKGEEAEFEAAEAALVRASDHLRAALAGECAPKTNAESAAEYAAELDRPMAARRLRTRWWSEPGVSGAVPPRSAGRDQRPHGCVQLSTLR